MEGWMDGSAACICPGWGLTSHMPWRGSKTLAVQDGATPCACAWRGLGLSRVSMRLWFAYPEHAGLGGVRDLAVDMVPSGDQTLCVVPGKYRATSGSASSRTVQRCIKCKAVGCRWHDEGQCFRQGLRHLK